MTDDDALGMLQSVVEHASLRSHEQSLSQTIDPGPPPFARS